MFIHRQETEGPAEICYHYCSRTALDYHHLIILPQNRF